MKLPEDILWNIWTFAGPKTYFIDNNIFFRERISSPDLTGVDFLCVLIGFALGREPDSMSFLRLQLNYMNICFDRGIDAN